LAECGFYFFKFYFLPHLDICFGLIQGYFPFKEKRSYLNGLGKHPLAFAGIYLMGRQP
jgi:hypothetical protein